MGTGNGDRKVATFLLRVVIYNRKNSCQYFKCFVNYAYSSVALSLAARDVNYDSKLGCKLKRNFTIVNYDLNTFIRPLVIQTQSPTKLQSANFFQSKVVAPSCIVPSMI